MEAYDMRDSKSINSPSNNISIQDELLWEEMLSNHVDGQRFSLGLHEGAKFPYSNGMGDQIRSMPEVVPSIPSKIEGSLTVSEFVSYAQAAVPIARQAKWADMPDWGSNQALADLSYYESSRNPTNKNPTSTAYGLFQFLDSTWPDYGISKSDSIASSFQDGPAIVNQIAAGMRYIFSVYKTPERALAFQRATVTKNSTNLPADLIPKWRIWISRGYSGY